MRRNQTAKELHGGGIAVLPLHNFRQGDEFRLNIANPGQFGLGQVLYGDPDGSVPVPLGFIFCESPQRLPDFLQGLTVEFRASLYFLLRLVIFHFHFSFHNYAKHLWFKPFSVKGEYCLYCLLPGNR